jgi:hypothetical protein
MTHNPYLGKETNFFENGKFWVHYLFIEKNLVNIANEGRRELEIIQ